MKRIGVIGAGHVGPVIARLALDAGFQVAIAGSGSPDKIALMTQIVIPGAEPRWAADAVQGADLVVLGIPLHNFANLDPALVAGKLVIDAMNYWPATDGVEEIFEDRRTTSSEIVQRRLPQSMVVKSLNHIGYQDLEDARRPSGSPERRTIGVAGDDPVAVRDVEDMIERFGFDTVRLDSLSAGRFLEPGGPVFGALYSRSEFEQALSARVA
ncbi:MAG TPA: NAD(P)-binding domain-containing protein [Candidatus Acidoferrum sp.]|nr:NAD(P)-binding domain-containing protein [Candidatus Acidoferrum sp.]